MATGDIARCSGVHKLELRYQQEMLRVPGSTRVELTATNGRHYQKLKLSAKKFNRIIQVSISDIPLRILSCRVIDEIRHQHSARTTRRRHPASGHLAALC